MYSQIERSRRTQTLNRHKNISLKHNRIGFKLMFGIQFNSICLFTLKYPLLKILGKLLSTYNYKWKSPYITIDVWYQTLKPINEAMSKEITVDYTIELSQNNLFKVFSWPMATTFLSLFFFFLNWLFRVRQLYEHITYTISCLWSVLLIIQLNFHDHYECNPCIL